MTCLDRETAAAYLSGDLDSIDAEQCAAHLLECAACCAIVEQVSGLMNGAREVLLLLDDPALETDPPSVEAVRARAAAPGEGSKSEMAGPGTKTPVLSLAVKGRGPRKIVPRGTLAFWLRPSRVITAGVALATAALLLFWTRGSSVSAAELLRDARAAEGIWSTQADQIVHRTFTIEERRLSAGIPVAHRKVEMWQNAAARIKVRRFYDERGTLIEGEWVERTGQRKLYRPNAGPEVQAEGQSAAGSLLQGDQIWRLELSARDFSGIVPNLANVTVTERNDRYILSYRRNSAAGNSSLTAATLMLSKPGLHPKEETLQVSAPDGPREFRLAEDGFVRLPASAVSPAVFQPEAALLGPAMPTAVRAAPTGVRSKRLSEPALLALEVRALHSLDAAGALVGEQVNVGRTASGTVRVDALVDTDERKAQILDALKGLRGTPGFRVNVETFAAAAAQQPVRSSGPMILREVEVPKDQIAVADELRRYFGRELSAPADSARLDEQVHRFAAKTIGQSRQLLLHAWALKRLAFRYSPDELRAVNAEALALWQSMVKEHAAAVANGAVQLRQALEPIFLPQLVSHPSSTLVCGSDADLAHRVECLLDLAHEQDKAIREAFAVSEATRNGTYVKTPQFWDSLNAIERLAIRIAESQ